MRVQGSIAEPALIGEKDRRAEFAMVVDRVASKPALFKNRRDAARGRGKLRLHWTKSKEP
jgi:hypothetical protein